MWRTGFGDSSAFSFSNLLGSNDSMLAHIKRDFPSEDDASTGSKVSQAQHVFNTHWQ
jgi:hypothetical protein